MVAWLALALASGCSDGPSAAASDTRMTKRNYDKIRVGMTHQEVTEILGDPTQKGPVLPSRSCFWVWVEEDKEILVLMDETSHVEGIGSQATKYSANLE